MEWNRLREWQNGMIEGRKRDATCLSEIMPRPSSKLVLDSQGKMLYCICDDNICPSGIWIYFKELEAE